MGYPTNKHGLNRYIPADVMQIVRRQCGYGCVICGLAFTQYEHFDPPFEEADKHEPGGIALLYGACHDKKTRGFWSPDKIAAARKDPTTFKQGFARDAFDLTDPFTLWLGNSSFEHVTSIVKTQEGERWLSIGPPEVAGGPVRVTATFFDDLGRPSLTIDENEWKVFSHHWDTDIEGPKSTARESPGDIILELVAAPSNGFKLTRLKMTRQDLGILIEPRGRVTIRRAGGETTFEGCSVDNSDTVLLV